MNSPGSAEEKTSGDMQGIAGLRLAIKHMRAGVINAYMMHRGAGGHLDEIEVMIDNLDDTAIFQEQARKERRWVRRMARLFRRSSH